MKSNKPIERKDIPHWGVDLPIENRPGVPWESKPHRAPGVHWIEPEQQTPSVPIQKHVGLDRLTPVFGTCEPLHGFSGAIRNFAYQIPEHNALHWMLLLVGDRVDAFESAWSERLDKRSTWAVLGAVPAAATATWWLAKRQRSATRKAA